MRDDRALLGSRLRAASINERDRGTPAAHAAHLATIPRNALARGYRPDTASEAVSILANASRIAAAKAGRP